MRASFDKTLTIQDQYQIKGDNAHHLLNVVRVELNEEILLLNGQGLGVKTKVTSVSKRELGLTKIEHFEYSRKLEMDLALGIPKKEALELSIKQAVELGFRRIYLIRSQYSQTKLPEADRLESLLISALEQSNAAFMPEMISGSWLEVPAGEYAEILMLDSQSKSAGNSSLKSTDKRLLVVGPEGGFSPEETTFLHQWPKVKVVNLPTPILRTPTAVAAGAGIILGSLLD